MPDRPRIIELQRPAEVTGPLTPGLADSFTEQLIDDVTHVVQRVRYIECAPFRLWSAGLISELAEAVDRLAVKVAKLKEQEAQGADR